MIESSLIFTLLPGNGESINRVSRASFSSIRSRNGRGSRKKYGYKLLADRFSKNREQLATSSPYVVPLKKKGVET